MLNCLYYGVSSPFAPDMRGYELPIDVVALSCRRSFMARAANPSTLEA